MKLFRELLLCRNDRKRWRRHAAEPKPVFTGHSVQRLQNLIPNFHVNPKARKIPAVHSRLDGTPAAAFGRAIQILCRFAHEEFEEIVERSRAAASWIMARTC